MANAFEIQVKALLESTQIQEQLDALQTKLKPLKINLDFGASSTGAAAGIQGQMSSAVSATESLGASVTNLGTKLQNTYSVGATGALKLESQVETVRTGYYDLAQTIRDVDKETGLLQDTTVKTSTDGITKQKEYQEYLRKELDIDREIELQRTEEYDLFVKQSQIKATSYKKYLQQEEDYQRQLELGESKQYSIYQKNQQSIKSLTIRVEGLTDAQKARINAEQRLAEISATTDIEKQASLIQGFTKDLSAVSYGMMNFASSIDYTVKRFMEIGAITLVFRTIKNVVSDMVQAVSDLDKSLVEVQKVTDLSGKSLEVFTSRAYKTGAEVARTGQEVIDATAIFARSGYEIEDALNLSKVAMVMMNVGDGIDSTSEAATSLISVLKGYNLEANEAIKVTDLINEVSNNAAINFEDLTEGLTRTSAVFNQAGVSIEKLSGLLTGTNEILQNVEMSSTGLITISQRCIYYTLIINHGAYVQKCA